MDEAARRRLQQDLTRLADGERDAFSSVFATLLPLLRGFARRALPAQDAEDAAQDALVKLFFRASEFDSSRDALSWALGVAAYEIKTSRRRSVRRRETDCEAVAARADAGPNPEHLAIARDLDAALETALGQLSSTEALTLRAYASGTRPEGVPAATFRKRVERGLARLRERWRARHGG